MLGFCRFKFFLRSPKSAIVRLSIDRIITIETLCCQDLSIVVPIALCKLLDTAQGRFDRFTHERVVQMVQALRIF